MHELWDMSYEIVDEHHSKVLEDPKRNVASKSENFLSQINNIQDI